MDMVKYKAGNLRKLHQELWSWVKSRFRAGAAHGMKHDISVAGPKARRRPKTRTEGHLLTPACGPLPEWGLRNENSGMRQVLLFACAGRLTLCANICSLTP